MLLATGWFLSVQRNVGAVETNLPSVALTVESKTADCYVENTYGP